MVRYYIRANAFGKVYILWVGRKLPPRDRLRPKKSKSLLLPASAPPHPPTASLRVALYLAGSVASFSKPSSAMHE